MLPFLQSTLKSALRGAGFRYERPPGSELMIWRRPLRKGGGAKLLALVPGFGDTPLSWLPLLGLLSKRKEFRQQEFDEVALLEFPGYLGSSRGAVCVAGADTYLGSLVSALDHLRPHTLIGQSMGGFSTAYYASEACQRSEHSLRQLVLMCPSGYVPHGGAYPDWTRDLEAVAQGRPDAFVRKALGPMRESLLLKLPSLWFGKELRRFLEREDTRAFLASFGPAHLLNARIPRISVPTVLIWGEKDDLVPFGIFPDWAKLLNEGVPVGHLCAHAIPGAGHGVHLEATTEVARLISTHAWQPEAQ